MFNFLKHDRDSRRRDNRSKTPLKTQTGKGKYVLNFLIMFIVAIMVLSSLSVMMGSSPSFEKAARVNVAPEPNAIATLTYNITFNETGLPLGTTWYVNLSNGASQNSTGSGISFWLIDGNYSADISSPSYCASPSVYNFTVNGGLNSMLFFFPVGFTSAINETFLTPVTTLDVFDNNLHNGYNVNYSAAQNVYNSPVLPFGTFSVAIDNSSNLLFAPNMAFGVVSVYNLTTDKLVKEINLGAYSLPEFSYYDPSNNTVFVSAMTGNITMINADTLCIIKNVSISQGGMSEITLRGSPSGDVVYALGSSGNLTTINAFTGSIIKNVALYRYFSNGEFGSGLYVYNGNAYMVSPSFDNLTIVNLSSYSVSTVALPTDYTPFSVVPYGNSGELLIGGQNFSNELYNTSSSKLSKGPFINGAVLASVYDPLNSMGYFNVWNTNMTSLANIFVVNTQTNKIMARVPGPFMPLGMAFDGQSHNIFVPGAVLGCIVIYNIPQYSVAFTESGLPAGTVWSATLNGQIKDSDAPSYSSISFADSNGLYDYTVANLTDYFALNYTGSVTVSGNTVTVNVEFEHYAYISGTLLPGNATLSINGKTITVTNGQFNISELPGSYNVVVSANGYSTYYDNFTLSSGQAQNLTVALKSLQSTPLLTSGETYAMIGGIAAVIAVSGSYIFLRRKK